ncbi:Bromodomain and WD repeat-containing protein 3 [Actinomortierella ambigua]|uniref:Bromodomain and WD repeat-containing protein 3 n=1 Tax=Actinomortierella ambigua TaxID=1343610 RepID=A0A9P6TXV4_9FUNG|nr:Bromodomain and WD repeat-containing protein 3 [Actinomortierella ambigua]
MSTLIAHTDAQIPPLVPGLRSLLSTGGSSLLRTRQETEQLTQQSSTSRNQSVSKLLFGVKGLTKEPRITDYLRARSMRGRGVASLPWPKFIPTMYEELVMMNGHRFSTYCLLFDRTNLRIITGSDDYLVKVWCARSGYLIYTLRGHAAEVTYADISPDNTMLVTGSNDGIVRVWDLQTSAPIIVLPTQSTTRHRKPITTVSFSPSPIPQIRYLMATTIDGFSWVWKYDRVSRKFQSKPFMIDCKTFSDSKLECATWNATGSQFAVAGWDLFIRVFSTIQGGPDAIKAGKRRKSYDKSRTTDAVSANGSTSSPALASSPSVASTNVNEMEWGEPVLIAQLDGHVGVVTSLCYSHSGDRILSGSVDGFVRIWQYDRKSKTWTSTAIDVRDEHTQADATISPVRTMVPSPAACQTQEQQPSTFAEQTGETSALGIAINTLTASAASIGGDTMGVITQPNSTTEASIIVPTPGIAAASIADAPRIVPKQAVWSLDDRSIVLTTSLGEIKVFDAKTGEWKHTLKGHTRFTEIYVVDVHPVDPRLVLTAGYDGHIFLWDIREGKQLRQWTFDDTEFSDGRFSPDGFMFAISDREGRCRLFGAGKNPDDYADARTFKEQTFWSDYEPVRYDADHNVIDDVTQIAPHLMDRTPILDTHGRGYARQKGLRYGLDFPVAVPGGILEQEEQRKIRQLEEELETLAEQTLMILPTTDKRKLYKRRREFIVEEDEDDDPMTSEVPIVPLPNDSSGEEYGGDDAGSDSSSGSESDAGDEDLLDEMEDNDDMAFVVNDDDDEYATSSHRRRRTASSNGTSRRQRTSNGTRRSGRARKRIRLAADEDEEDESDGMYGSGEDGEAEGSRTASRRQKRLDAGEPSMSKSERSARPKSFANDDYPSDDMLDIEGQDSEDDYDGTQAGSSAGASTTSLPQTSLAIQGTSIPKKKKRQWRGNGRKKGKAVMTDDQANDLLKWLPSNWIKVNTPRKSPYHPQIGDYVAYCRQGHQNFLAETPLRSRLDIKIVPYLKDPALPWVVFGRISRITYNVGPPTWCTITLEEQILESSHGYPPQPTFTPSRRRFDIEFHDVEDVPDFIILYSVFQHGVNAQYQVGEEIWASFDDHSYAGTISDQVIEDPRFEDSLWMAFRVTWSSQEATNLSPWEMQHEEDEEYTTEQIPSQGRQPPPTKEAECARIDQVLKHLMHLDEFQEFRSEVDFVAYPTYCQVVAYPICLESIVERFESGFYRRARAVQFDIELVEQNAVTYNDPTSTIAMMARNLAKIYKTCVADQRKTLPDQVRVRLSRDDGDEEFNASGSDHNDAESEPEIMEEDEDDLAITEESDVDDFVDDDFGPSYRRQSSSRSSKKRTGSGQSSSKAAGGSLSRSTRRSNDTNGLSSTTRSKVVGQLATGGSSTSSSSNRRSSRGKSASRSANQHSKPRRRSAGDDDGDDDYDEDEYVEEEGDEEAVNVYGDADDDDDDAEWRGGSNGHGRRIMVEDDDEDEEFGSQNSRSRSTRSRRKKAKMADSDDDYE